MKREEYWKIMEIIENLGIKEDQLCENYCNMNKTAPEEVRRRRRDREHYKEALRIAGIEIREAFRNRLED